ncbi:MAG: enoyl-CoA hydratase/isomerase family protein [Acidipropionibacterium jensenii]|uniref:enoyl-CoA hydratase/isomerase family protein n=1 Tax=Acidipropionibacterium jensenii TaxID=1749 RepID=UPI0026492B07|nr:enoyl-CoA hydratase/isomerase family protein [Acidipropionibacterium jensenii]MDN6512846.1 enoyl-CoA hydratase/isomerase family protein [Acidipropionibacterium jensenii]
MSDLIISRDPTGVSIELNRPRAINSLSGRMLAAIGTEVAGARRVDLTGAGPKGFCAGADIRELRTLALSDPEQAGEWLDVEYTIDLAIARVGTGTAHLHGISMGGGLGLSLRLSRVEARQDLVLAMPEVGIGLWPDVGATFELSRAPRLAGRHLAMTGCSIDAASALWAGLVDVVVDETGRQLPVTPQASALARSAHWIEACYDSADPVAVVEALRRRPEPQARSTADLIATRSPLSVAVALEAVRRAEHAGSLEEVLDTDRRLGRSFMRRSDFCEGVRAQLVDKDHHPRWRHAGLADVTRAEVEKMFG